MEHDETDPATTHPASDGTRPAPEVVIHGEPTRIDVYWRRGCGYCMALRRALHKAGLEVHEVDIWSDPQAAAFVREHANGNETVPTVAIGATVLVNPPARTVLALAEEAGLWARPADDGRHGFFHRSG